jgi:hypothetical protein
MEGLEAFLDSYGVAAACAVMLVKAMGVPIPIPGDVILLATAARAAEGKVLLWLAFVALLVALDRLDSSLSATGTASVSPKQDSTALRPECVRAARSASGWAY